MKGANGGRAGRVAARVRVAVLGLEELAGRLTEGGEEAACSGAREWRKESCDDNNGVARAALAALRGEAAAERQREGDDSGPADDPFYQALVAVERALWPEDVERVGYPAPVEMPRAMRERLGPDAVAGRLRGGAEVVASPLPDSGGMLLTVSHPERFPTYAEILAARVLPGRGAPTLWAMIPPDGGGPEPDLPGGPPYVVRIFERPPTGGGASGLGGGP